MTILAEAHASIDWAGLPRVEAAIGYLPRSAGRRVTLDFTGGYQPPRELIATPIHDLSGVRDRLSIDREGFALMPFGKASDPGNPAWVDTVWRPAAEDAVRRLSGASRTVSWEFNMRFSTRSPESRRTIVSRPADNAHSDFGPGQFVGTLAHPSPLAALAGTPPPRRWRCFNVWQAVSETPFDSALALCDSSSLDPDDMAFAYAPLRTGSGGDFLLELCQYRHNPAQRWGYVRDIRRDELLIFSGLDPAAGAPWGAVPHTAFTDPGWRPGTPPRNSVELRVLALFDD